MLTVPTVLELTGISQLTALIFAFPLGYLSSRGRRSRVLTSSSNTAQPDVKPSSYPPTTNIPLLLGALVGTIAYPLFGSLSTPEFQPSHHDSASTTTTTPAVLLLAALLGLSQISAIVCSLGLLGGAVLSSPATSLSTSTSAALDETDPLLPAASEAVAPERNNNNEQLLALKGSLAGTYSLVGGAGILLLTKLGGWMFDHVSVGAPFYLLAGFNAVLLAVGVTREIQAGRAPLAAVTGDRELRH